MADVRRTGDIVDIVCESAIEFVSLLDPMTGPFLQPPQVPVYLFRGVSSLTYALIPAAFRTDKYLLDGVVSTWKRAPMDTVRHQCAAELATLRAFFETAASHGIRLPEDSQLLRQSLDQWQRLLLGVTNNADLLWPPPEFLSLIALAQHYGVATRALDWSWSPLVAAYFAARDLPQTSHDWIVVWVFEYYAKRIDLVVEPLLPQERPLMFFTAPGAENENLRAQRGMFLLQVHKTSDLDQSFIPESYDTLAPRTVAVRDIPLLKRVLVSSSEALEVLTHLSLGGFTPARLFPGLWGVARELEERRLIAESNRNIGQIAATADIRARIKQVEKSGA